MRFRVKGFSGGGWAGEGAGFRVWGVWLKRRLESCTAGAPTFGGLETKKNPGRWEWKQSLRVRE